MYMQQRQTYSDVGYLYVQYRLFLRDLDRRQNYETMRPLLVGVCIDPAIVGSLVSTVSGYRQYSSVSIECCHERMRGIPLSYSTKKNLGWAALFEYKRKPPPN
jgi:hypothetical protein